MTAPTDPIQPSRPQSARQVGHLVQGDHIGHVDHVGHPTGHLPGHLAEHADGRLTVPRSDRPGGDPALGKSEWVDPPQFRIDRPTAPATVDGYTTEHPDPQQSDSSGPVAFEWPQTLTRSLTRPLTRPLTAPGAEPPTETFTASSCGSSAAADTVVPCAPHVSLADLGWLIRFAQRTPSIRTRFQQPQGLVDSQSPEDWLRSQFEPAAWRLVCRSDPKNFAPIVNNARFRLADLCKYAQALVRCGWQEAPDARWLDLLIVQSYYYFNRCPSVPTERTELDLVWIAQRDGHATQEEFVTLNEWSFRTKFEVTRRHTWRSLWRRYQVWADETEAEELSQQAEPWHFYCGPTLWRGLEILPLTTPYALWVEGRAMHSCLYALARLCTPDGGSRFFSVQRDGKRIATLELQHCRPDPADVGMAKVRGRWVLVDCRHACNLLVDSALIATLRAFATQYSQWSHRPGRWPENHGSNAQTHLHDSDLAAHQPEAEGEEPQQGEKTVDPIELPPSDGIIRSPQRHPVSHSGPPHQRGPVRRTISLKLNPPVYRPWPERAVDGAGKGRAL